MNKKALELSMNFIIIAVIGLAVLLVVLFMFGGKAKFFFQATENECSAADCENAYADTCSEDQIIRYAKLAKDQPCKYNDKGGVYDKEGTPVKCCVDING